MVMDKREESVLMGKFKRYERNDKVYWMGVFNGRWYKLCNYEGGTFLMFDIGKAQERKPNPQKKQFSSEQQQPVAKIRKSSFED